MAGGSRVVLAGTRLAAAAAGCFAWLHFIPYREFIVFNRLRVSPHGVGRSDDDGERSWNGGTARAFVTGAAGRCSASSSQEEELSQIPGGYGGRDDAAMTRERERERERDVNVGIEAKYQAVILARSNGRGRSGRRGGGDNSNQLLCFCPSEPAALAAADEGGGGEERKNKTQSRLIRRSRSVVERWAGRQACRCPTATAKYGMSGTSSQFLTGWRPIFWSEFSHVVDVGGNTLGRFCELPWWIGLPSFCPESSGQFAD